MAKVLKAYLDKIIATCGLSKFAVLTSGIDSEIIVRYLAKKKVDVEMYHIKFWLKDNTEPSVGIKLLFLLSKVNPPE